MKLSVACAALLALARIRVVSAQRNPPSEDVQICDPVGVYDVLFHCEDGGNVVGPVPQFHEIFDRGDGFYNFYAQLASPHLQFNFTMLPIPGEVNMYQGAVSWTNYYPGPIGEENRPVGYLPAIIPIQVEFDEDCNYWTEWFTQRPGFGRGGLSQDNIFTPPTHPCHTGAFRRGSGFEIVSPPNENVGSEPFLDTYHATVKCFVGYDELEEFEETHVITTIPASEQNFYLMTRSRADGYTSIDVLSQNGYRPTEMYGGTQNVTNYNLVETDPYWFDEHPIPLTKTKINFEDDSFDRYDAVLTSPRPGPGIGGYDWGHYACVIKGTRQGLEPSPPKPSGCDPTGRYDTTVDCRRYLSDVAVFPEDFRIENLGHGFYVVSQYQSRRPDFVEPEVVPGIEDLFVMRSLIVEDPTKPGFMTGIAFYRSDFVAISDDRSETIEGGESYNSTLYPIYITVQYQFEDAGDDGMCDSFNTNLQGYRPWEGSTDFDDRDVLHYCWFDGHKTRMGAVVDESCTDGTSGCLGVCYEGEYDYVTRCIARQGPDAAENFVTEILTPNPVVVESTCADLGFSVELEGGSCPDHFYGFNDACVYVNDLMVIEQAAPSIFDPAYNPYVELYEFPWGAYWRQDNPQCQYVYGTEIPPPGMGAEVAEEAVEVIPEANPSSPDEPSDEPDDNVRICDPVGVYDVLFHCEDGGNIVGPVPQFHEIFDRGDGFYNFYAQLASPHLQFNFTMLPIPGEVNMYQGAVSWTNYYPGPIGQENRPPRNIPAIIPIQVEFDEDCNYWTEWFTQRPGFGRGGLSQDNIFTPPTHPCHTGAFRRGSGFEIVSPPNENVGSEPFLDTYHATVKCFVGYDEIEEFEETHVITTIPASEQNFYLMTRSRADGYTSIDVLSQNGYRPTEMYGGTQNVTNFNLVETDPGWWDEHLIPLTKTKIMFEDDSFDRYDAVLTSQRPGPGIDGYESGIHVCRIQATRQGLEPSPPKPSGCDPTGRYDTMVDCRRYSVDVGQFPEDHRIENLGHGFYVITFYHFTPNLPEVVHGIQDLFVMRSLLVEDPTKPGFLMGSTFYRNDFLSRKYSIIDYPLYINIQAQFEDADNDGMCDTWNANLQGYRPWQWADDDVIHYCWFDSQRIRVGAVVDSSCTDGTSGCAGVCYDGPYDYVSTCVAREGAPNFVTEILTPNPVVLETTCAELGFTEQLEGGSCPDHFYGFNDVCVYVSDISVIEAAVPSIFNPELNPYVEYFEFPYGQYWRNDNPQCEYETAAFDYYNGAHCPIAGRYNCPIEVCNNFNETVLDGSQGQQTLLIHDRGLGYFDMEVIDNPFGVSWSAIMYQKKSDRFTLTGAMYRTSNHVSTYENPDHQLLEAHFDESTGCTTFDMILRAWTSVPREWPSPYHGCNLVCHRIANGGSELE